MTVPQLGFTFSQRHWPGARDVDDCWCLAGLQAGHAVAPWLPLVGVPAYRRAAGKPDDPTAPNPGDERDIARGLAGLYPSLVTVTLTGVSWSAFLEAVKPRGVAAILFRAGALPARLQHGYAGPHAAAVENVDGRDWLIDDPLARPHSKPQPIRQPELRAAVEALRPKVYAVVMPDAIAAARTGPGYRQGQADEYARQAAGARVELVPLEGLA